MRKTLALLVAPLFALGVTACEVEQEQPAERPEVEVEPGQPASTKGAGHGHGYAYQEGDGYNVGERCPSRKLRTDGLAHGQDADFNAEQEQYHSRHNHESPVDKLEEDSCRHMENGELENDYDKDKRQYGLDDFQRLFSQDVQH